MSTRRLGGLAILGLLLAACRPAPQHPAAAPPLRHLKVVMLPYSTSAPLIIAKERGFFARHGIEVEWVPLERSSESLPALTQGQIDVVPGGINAGLINLVASGARIRLVANKGMFPKTGCTGAAALIGRKGLPPWPGSLRGARVTVQPMLFTELLVDRILLKYGIPRDSITRVDLPKGAVGEALAKGAVDFVMTSEPVISRSRQLGSVDTVIEASEILPEFDHGYLVFGPNLLTADPDAGRRFLMGYIEGARAYMQGKTEENVKTLATAMKEDEAMLRTMCWMPLRPDLGVDEASVKEFVEWSAARGVLKSVPALEQMIDPAPLKDALQALAAEGGQR